MNWTDIITYDNLKERAGNRSFSAGQDYARSGAVSGLMADDNTITAQVQGTEIYWVELTYDEDEGLWGECSCPYGEEGNFCKHCVAVGLAWMEEASAPPESSNLSATSVRAYLETLNKTQLVALLLEQVKKDVNLQNRLMLKIAQSSANAPDLDKYRKAIDRAIAVPEYLDYDEIPKYKRGVRTVLQSLKELQESGFANETRLLAQHALKELNGIVEQIEDEEGAVIDLINDFLQLHLQATLQDPPPPDELTDWLFDFEMSNEWGDSIEWQDYLPALGDGGEERFRCKVVEEWEKLPALAPGDRGSWDGNRFRLTELMTSLVRQTGDVHALIDLKKRDLSSSGKFLEIAQLYLDAGEPENALEWAEQGRVLFGENTDSRLLDFLVQRYTELERYADAYEILWHRFEFMPNMDRYQELCRYAEGRGEWEVWRVRAWERLRQYLEERKSDKPGSTWLTNTVDHSDMVRILLWEERADEAWDEAQAGGCSRELWMELAQARAVTHPEDALRLYREQVARLTEGVTNGDYSESLKYLRKIRDIMERTRQSAAFEDYVRLLRNEYKRKRNFIKLLDQNRFPA